ncbi:MAG: GDSL-type esterase/lipase family protein, partial [Polyangiales bacterium]
VYLTRSLQQQYARECEVRLDPAGLRDYAKERTGSPPQPDRPVLVFFGDSRALMWGTPAIEGYDVRNVGVGFQTTAQLLLRFDADVPRLKPKIIVLEAGVNDLKAVAVLPARRDEIVADCKKNLAALVERSRATGATVVLTGIFAIGDVPFYRKTSWSDGVAPTVVEVNTYLKSLTSESVLWLDADPVLDDARGKIKPDLQHDFLHVNAAGYAALTEKLAPLVKR